MSLFGNDSQCNFEQFNQYKTTSKVNYKQWVGLQVHFQEVLDAKY